MKNIAAKFIPTNKTERKEYRSMLKSIVNSSIIKRNKAKESRAKYEFSAYMKSSWVDVWFNVTAIDGCLVQNKNVVSRK
jgi:hypothetical protein